MERRRVAVTGANGFLGAAVVRAAEGRGATVRHLVRRPTGAADEVIGDLKRGGWPDSAFEDVDVVVHCAASLGGPSAHQEQVNVAGTELTAAAANAAGVGTFIHISSVAVYGYDGVHFGEDRPIEPSRQTYSRTKAAAEAVVRRTFPEAIILRPGGIFGPGANFWSLQFARRARRRIPLAIGDGAGTLPVIFVDDVADLAMTAADRGPGAEIFNCVLDPAPSWREYQAAYGTDRWWPLPGSVAQGVATLAARFGRSGSNLAVVDELLRYARRVKRFPMDKAREVLGWQPPHDLATGVAATVPWLRTMGVD